MGHLVELYVVVFDFTGELIGMSYSLWVGPGYYFGWCGVWERVLVLPI